jgi:DNA replication and repair protein RecF
VFLSSLALKNFRNYESLALSFSQGLNVIYGKNAQGKTNLLEAIYFLSAGRSHRTSHDQELIREGTSGLSAKALVSRRTGDLQLELSCGLDVRKQVKINGVAERKIARLVGGLTAVFFSPDDLQLLKGSPSGRRRFLDIELSQVSQTYLHNLISYNKVLSQRNHLLKHTPHDPMLLSVLNQQLIEFGSQLIVRRANAVLRLGPIAASFHSTIADHQEALTMQYQSYGIEKDQERSLTDVSSILEAQIRQKQGDELRRQITLVGPHRDDIGFTIANRDARFFASQGQQRTAVLALKLAEIEFMRQETGEHPILLLDDVTSELDPNRRHFLLRAVEDGLQTFITCTDLEDLMVRQWPIDHALFRVTMGSVERDNRGLN